jgi:hypothetical protein
MEYIAELFHNILYMGLGRLIFGEEFSKDSRFVPAWKKIVLFLISLLIILAVVVLVLNAWSFLRDR